MLGNSEFSWRQSRRVALNLENQDADDLGCFTENTCLPGEGLNTSRARAGEAVE
jgi:hypothetical protein